MPQTSSTNRRVVLAERPKGLPNTNTLRLEETEIQQAGAGEMYCARFTFHLILICGGG